eukprot:gene4301-21181_t
MLDGDAGELVHLLGQPEQLHRRALSACAALSRQGPPRDCPAEPGPGVSAPPPFPHASGVGCSPAAAASPLGCDAAPPPASG